MMTLFSSVIRFASAAAVFAAVTLAQPAAAIETTCTGSGGANCPSLIPDGPLPGVSSTVIVPANICGGGTPTGASVRVNLSHSWIGDLSITVKNPANVTSNLLNQLPDPPAVSCAGDDIAAVFQDGGATPVCQSASVPSLSGTLAPVSALTPLAASVVGTWTLTVTDNMHGNNGLINDWAVDVVCGAAPPVDVGVTLSGFPTSVVQGSSPITGNVTCSNVGAAVATNVTCSVAGGTASSCVQQPGATPVASFPVASLAVGGSITCAVSAPSTSVGVTTITATTSATADSNPANNTATAAITVTAPGTADMGVAFSGFPASAAANAAVAGTVTCTNLGSVAATSATCAVAGATASNCVQQPGATPVASFPVASVAAGGSIACSVNGTMPASGSLVLTGTTGASNDNNAANNTTTATITAQTTNNGGPSVPAPALSWYMQLVMLSLLLGTGVWLSRKRKLS
jgi:subtilisin-like proprotein convertase family protein